MEWSIVLPIVGVIVAPLLTYLAARRQASGRIDTTEAARLWDEAERLRAAYKEERVEDRAQLALLRAETIALRAEAVALRAESAALRIEAASCRQETEQLRQELAKIRSLRTK